MDKIHFQITVAENRFRRPRLAAAQSGSHACEQLAAAEWKGIKNSTTTQCERLEQVANDLQDRFAWREILWGAFWFSLAVGFGVFIGHYCWTH